jgi:hypothetical protein
MRISKALEKAMLLSGLLVQVVACYKGKGKVSGLDYASPHWVEGRLWLYDDGDMGFLWLDTLNDFLLVDLKRIDSDVR